MNYKAAIFDIDGTLVPLNATKTSAFTCRAIRAARQAGVVVILATGRGPTRAVPAIIGDVVYDYSVCVNGACALSADGSVLFADTLTPAQIEELLAFGRQENAQISFTYLDGYYACLGADRLIGEYEERCGESLPIIDAEQHPRTDGALPYGGFLTVSDAAAAAYNERGTELRLVRFMSGHYDICKRTVNKAQSLGRLLQSIGMTWQDAVAFGDGFNDVEMLEHAGLGVSFEDSRDAAKAASGLVADASTRDGAAKALIDIFGLSL